MRGKDYWRNQRGGFERRRHGIKCLFFNKDSWGGVKKQTMNLESKKPKAW
jgi:hypothetical protein